MRDLLVGIDGGTGGVRSYIFDQSGTIISKCECSYRTLYPKDGWAEQYPEEWWTAVCQSVRGAMEKADITADRILAIGTDTTSCTVLACSSDGQALGNAILWMDVRASSEQKDILRLTGQELFAEHFPCKALWLKHHEPSIYEDAAFICEYQDFLNYRLTGIWCFSVNTACNWGYDSRKGGFDEAFYHQIGLGDILQRLPQKAVRAGESIGYLTRQAAEALNLDEGVIVAQGGIDASIGMLGMGVTQPGSIALMTGSSNLAMAVTPEPFFAKEGAINQGPDFLINGYYTSVQGQSASGSILKWFIREFCRDLGDDAYRILDQEAAQIPCGENELITLDYWQGNRVPYNDPTIRGMVYGMSMGTTRGMMFRSLMEGIAFGTEELIQAFRDKGEDIKKVCISGGTTRSDIFMQIHADVSGVPFEIASDYAPALGSAICAGTAAKVFIDFSEGVRCMVRKQGVIEPDPENHKKYEKILDQYRRIYPMLREWRRKGE